MSFLFDTMALSEPGKARPNTRALAWIQSVPITAVSVSVVTIGEIAFGVFRLPPSARRTRLEAWLHGDLLSGHIGRVLPIDAAVAVTWAQLKASATQTPPLMDSLIAATAIAHGLTVVTRNERDFAGLGVRVVNPWT